jgi:hypothetical protein
VSDNLRDRIAAVQAQHHHWDYAGALACACGEEFGRYPSDGWEAAVKDWSEHVADAVIATLGIYEDEMGTGATRRTRIISDWEKP